MDRLSSVPCGYLCFGDDRLVVEANDEAARLLGCEAPALRGLPLHELLPPAARVFFQIYVHPMLALNQQLQEVYVTLRRRDGQDVPVLLNATRRQDEGRPMTDLAFIATCRRTFVEQELLEAKVNAERLARAEKEAALARVRDLQAQLAEQQRLATIGTLTAGVAHEINNPLAYVSGNLELLLESLQAGAEHAHASADVDTLLVETLDGIERIRNIVSGLRSWSRVDDGRRVCVDLSKVADIARRLTANEVRKRARLDVSAPAMPVRVAGNEGRLVQVAVNLVVNAAQAFPDDGPSRNWIRLITKVEGELAVLEVVDNGPGIPPDVQPRVFDPFFTTKPIGVGTGLGLAVCRGIVSSFDGVIDFESDASGTTFRVKLPLWNAEDPCVETTSSPPSHGIDSGFRITSATSRTRGT